MWKVLKYLILLKLVTLQIAKYTYCQSPGKGRKRKNRAKVRDRDRDGQKQRQSLTEFRRQLNIRLVLADLSSSVEATGLTLNQRYPSQEYILHVKKK